MTSEKGDELKPCPFCGEPGRVVRDGDHHGEYFNLGCVAELMTDYSCPGALIYYTEPIEKLPTAIAAWNQRPPVSDAELRECFYAAREQRPDREDYQRHYLEDYLADKYETFEDYQAWKARR